MDMISHLCFCLGGLSIQLHRCIVLFSVTHSLTHTRVHRIGSSVSGKQKRKSILLFISKSKNTIAISNQQKNSNSEFARHSCLFLVFSFSFHPLTQQHLQSLYSFSTLLPLSLSSPPRLLPRHQHHFIQIQSLGI